MDRMASISGVMNPPIWTSTTTAVSGVRAASSVSGERASVSGETSARRGIPPACTTAAAVAKKVLVGMTTSRPSTAKVRKMISRALVPLLTATGVRHIVAEGERLLELAGARAEGERAVLQRLIDHAQDRLAILRREDDASSRYTRTCHAVSAFLAPIDAQNGICGRGGPHGRKTTHSRSQRFTGDSGPVKLAQGWPRATNVRWEANATFHRTDPCDPPPMRRGNSMNKTTRRKNPSGRVGHHGAESSLEEAPFVFGRGQRYGSAKARGSVARAAEPAQVVGGCGVP